MYQPFGFNTIKNLASGRRGSWGTPELGWTEAIGDILGAGRNIDNGSMLRTEPTPANTVRPAENISPGVIGQNQGVVLGNQTNLPSWEYLDSLPYSSAPPAPTAPTAPQTPGLPIGFEERIRNQRSMLDNILNRALGVYNEGMGALSSKRKQFEDLFAEGNEDILQEGQRAKGEAQTSAQGARTRNANALRALGLGGSALVNTQGRQAQNEARTLASINDQTSAGKRENRQAYNTNLDWANAQESALNRYREDAQGARQAGENQLNEGLFDFINNLASNQMAQALSGIGGYEANPYQANIGNFTDSINSIVRGLTGGQQQENMGVSIDPNDQFNIFRRLRPGLSLV